MSQSDLISSQAVVNNWRGGGCLVRLQQNSSLLLLIIAALSVALISESPLQHLVHIKAQPAQPHQIYGSAKKDGQHCISAKLHSTGMFLHANFSGYTNPML